MRRSWPAVRVVIAGFLPCPDLPSRWRMRREVVSLIGLQAWPGMNASSEDVAQLAMLRLLHLQKQVHRLVLLRQREASVVMARYGVETLLLGLYCMRVPGAVARLHAGNVKVLGDTLAYLEKIVIAPASVIRECARVLGQPAKAHLTPWDMVQAIDDSNDNKAARSIYWRLYLSLSHFTVHAGGGTLIRYVGAGEAAPAAGEGMDPSGARPGNRRSGRDARGGSGPARGQAGCTAGQVRLQA